MISTNSNRTVLARRAYQNYAPRIWNNLPQHLRDMIHMSGSQRAFNVTASRCDNINISKSKLKTFLFTQAYDVP